VLLKFGPGSDYQLLLADPLRLAAGEDYPLLPAAVANYLKNFNFLTPASTTGRDTSIPDGKSSHTLTGVVQDFPVTQASLEDFSYPGTDGKAHSSEQSINGQDYPIVQAVRGQDYPTVQAVSGQDYQTAQAVSGQDYPIAQVVNSQDYSITQAVSGQDYPAGDGRNYPVVLQASGRLDSRLQILANDSANPLAFLTGPAAQLFLRSSS
jgi:hypothetical protein